MKSEVRDSSSKSDNSPVQKQAQNITLFTIFVIYTVLLVIVAWMSPDQINPDAAAYIQIAQYFANGDTDLMISGYWGPLLSWLIVPGLFFFDDPLNAARAAMIVSAVVYLAGALCVFRAVKLSVGVVTLGVGLVALFGLPWSMFVITPDLLMGGVLCFGISLLLSERWSVGGRTAFCAGLLLGAAYLTKAIALPASVLILLLVAALNYFVHKELRRTVKAVSVTMAGILIVAGPWIGLLSAEYERPIFSTSGPINHAIVGPNDVERFHPGFHSFHKPPVGRVSSWETPSYLQYKYWSPFDNAHYAVHQVKLVARNAFKLIQTLQRFDLFGIGLLAAIFAFVFATPWKEQLAAEPWRLSIIPMVSIGLLYLPVHSSDLRYYWPLAPFMLAASFGFVLNLLDTRTDKSAVMRLVALGLITVSFVGANSPSIAQVINLPHDPDYEAAKILARTLDEAKLLGSVAGVGDDEDHTSYYLAFITAKPWYGRLTRETDAREVFLSGASLIVTSRGSGIAAELDASPCYASIESKVPEKEVELAQLPVKVFLVSTSQDNCGL